MLSLSDYKKIINKSRSRNMQFVTIKEDRVYKLCKTILVSGSSALAINPRRGSRFWVCEECVSLKLKVVNSVNALSLVSFGMSVGTW